MFDTAIDDINRMAMTAISLSMSYVEILMPSRHNKQRGSLSKRQVDRRKTRAVPPSPVARIGACWRLHASVTV